MIEESRVSVVDGRPLPAARSISLLVFQERELLSPAVTLMHMTFGQLLDHDIGRTAVAKLAVNVSRTGNDNKIISVVHGLNFIPRKFDADEQRTLQLDVCHLVGTQW